MNPTKLRKLADAIEKADDDTFDMASWFTTVDVDIERGDMQGGAISEECGTAGCIAGWACSMFLPPGAVIREMDIKDKATELLEATDSEKWKLFDVFTSTIYWNDRGCDIRGLDEITNDMAANELRDLAHRVEHHLPL